jgi:hypothetical protein
MHVVIEKARKAAGISGLTKNYPDNSKQRGCGYWAAFIGSISNDLGRVDQEQKEMEHTISEQARKIADLEGDLNGLRSKACVNGIFAIAREEEWTVDKRERVQTMLVGS